MSKHRSGSERRKRRLRAERRKYRARKKARSIKSIIENENPQKNLGVNCQFDGASMSNDSRGEPGS